MRRALALLLALTLLGAAGLVYAHRAVAATAEAVEMRETVLCGDSSAARGIGAGAGYPAGVAGRGGVYGTAVCGLLRVQRYGHRYGGHVRL